VDAIDYAGLFPPASLSLPLAVEEYARSRASEEAWALGRFVVAAARLPELAEALRAAGARDRVLVAATFTSDLESDLASVTAATGDGGILVDTVEFRAPTPEALADALARVPSGLQRFAEWPLDQDPVPFIRLLKLRGAGAKFRTGGIVPEAIPAVAELLRGLDPAVRAGVPFKCTAGLHHPWRGRYRLTYEASSPEAVMHGYLNVMLAVAALVGGQGIAVARQILEDDDPSHLVVHAEGLGWKDILFDRAALRALRRRGLRSFGSCSFREPMDELAALVT
jgi:hypothetical protein